MRFWTLVFSLILSLWSNTCYSTSVELHQQITVLENAPSTSAPILQRNSIEIVAGAGEGQATLTVGDNFQSGSTAWSLSFATPVNKDSNSSELANLNGLSNSVRTTLQMSWFLGEPVEFANPNDYKSARNSVCQQAAELKKLSNPETYQNDKCTDTTDDGKDFFRVQEGDPVMSTAGSDLRETQRQLKRLGRRYDCISWAGKDADNCHKFFTILSASGTLGTEGFDFFDSDAMAKATNRESVWSAEVAASFLHIPSGWLYRVAYRREEAFKPANKLLFCSPTDPDTILTCQELPGAPPSDNDKDVITVEARRNLGSYGIAPKLSFDLESDVTGIELPVFLAKNENGRLTGGLIFGWRDDADELTLGVFVGAPFKIF